MAKFKKTGGKRAGNTSQSQAEDLSRKLSESAQQVWLAGVGAFGRAQAEGTKLFEALVKEGMNFEQSARRFAGGRADQVRDAVESRVGEARERANDTWDRLEKVFEDRVQRALVKLNVPGREDLTDLATRVDALTAELCRQNGGAAPRKRAGKTAAKKGTTRATAERTSVRKTAKTASSSRRPRKST
jgi:poly(hydroxyalkanoate) granule-associated protein